MLLKCFSVYVSSNRERDIISKVSIVSHKKKEEMKLLSRPAGLPFAGGIASVRGEKETL
jgi:hypothetical protein